MIAIIGILFLATVLAGTFVLREGRRLVIDAQAIETRLGSPGTHTLTYLVPNGQDPAALMGALLRSRFTAAVDTHGGLERLLIGCEESDRAHVREILETVRGGPMDSRIHVPVCFEDEPGTVAS
jgi:hypothetical protein